MCLYATVRTLLNQRFLVRGPSMCFVRPAYIFVIFCHPVGCKIAVNSKHSLLMPSVFGCKWRCEQLFSLMQSVKSKKKKHLTVSKARRQRATGERFVPTGITTAV
jgi:hypothetical protein